MLLLVEETGAPGNIPADVIVSGSVLKAEKADGRPQVGVFESTTTALTFLGCDGSQLIVTSLTSKQDSGTAKEYRCTSEEI